MVEIDIFWGQFVSMEFTTRKVRQNGTILRRYIVKMRIWDDMCDKIIFNHKFRARNIWRLSLDLEFFYVLMLIFLRTRHVKSSNMTFEAVKGSNLVTDFQSYPDNEDT